ncbi:hypothetical protein [Pseudomonas protegens]|uniref:hypothetical protein n=1 Tax=Pseudomonas protegens TaxID=380021 RepID=UPI0012D78FA7|nr:hypothetical protein [Pseudomonas protegens]
MKAAASLILYWDLKSPARKGVPVRFRLRAPSISRACTVFLSEPYPELLRNFKYCSAIHFEGETFLPLRVRVYCSGHHYGGISKLIFGVHDIVARFSVVFASLGAQNAHLE